MNYFEIIFNILSPILGDKIFPIDAYQETEPPYIVMDLSQIEPIDGKKNITKSHQVSFSIIVLDVSVDNAQVTSTTVRKILDKYCSNEVESMNFQSSTIAFNSTRREYMQVSEFISRMNLPPVGDYAIDDYNSIDYLIT